MAPLRVARWCRPENLLDKSNSGSCRSLAGVLDAALPVGLVFRPGPLVHKMLRVKILVGKRAPSR